MTLSDAGRVNVADRLRHHAQRRPHEAAIVVQRRRLAGGFRYEVATFEQLDRRADAIARGLRRWGVPPAARLALLVKPGIDFITLVFGLLRAGAVSVLIDPGMGKRNLLGCLEEVRPDGFVAIPAAQAIRTALGGRFPSARWNVTVGPRWWFGGRTLCAVERSGAAANDDPPEVKTAADDPAAVIFTTGSTGPPKGVLYLHRNFDRQVEEIQAHYGIEPGNVNLACFPLFGLFNAAMGVTTVVPDMDASRPAQVDPRRIVAAVRSRGVTQSFASPAVWRRVAEHCVRHGERLPTLRAAYSAGAPVPPEVIERVVSFIAAGGRLHTPYGATEALPVSTIDSAEILAETRAAWAAGRGTCVGRRFPGIEWRIVRIVDGPISRLAEAMPLAVGEIGDLIVRGDVVTPRYVTRVDADPLAKIRDADGSVWHRMGDAGYVDERERFWFCGRVAHRVVGDDETWYTDPVEGIFNQVPGVARSALVGIGPRGRQEPVVVVERDPSTSLDEAELFSTLRLHAERHPTTARIRCFLTHRSFPVDIRHNSKIFREQLAVWAAAQLGDNPAAASSPRSQVSKESDA